MSVGELVALLIVGALAGTAAAAVTGKRKKESGEWLRNTIIGILGAFVGGFIFRALNVNIPESLSISLGDLIVAFIGAVLVIVLVDVLRR